MRLRKVLVVYTNLGKGELTKEQKRTLDIVKKILGKYEINCNLADRDHLKKEQLLGKDLIIAVGGDGTFLRASQFIVKQLIFGVNADIKNKEGFFMQSNKNDFEKKLRKIMKNNFKIRKFPRLEAYIDNKKINALALNEFFIGPRKAYHSAKYVISVDGKKERHKSSGILITTPAGSYAWAKACCNKTMPLNSKNYQYVVREPYEGKIFKNYRLKRGILNKNQKISVISEMRDGIVLADSVGKEYELKYSSKAVIKLSNNNLKVVWF